MRFKIGKGERSISMVHVFEGQREVVLARQESTIRTNSRREIIYETSWTTSPDSFIEERSERVMAREVEETE